MQRVARHLQHVGQRLGVFAQQLFQIPRAAGHRVIQQHVLPTRPALSTRLILRSNSQMIYLAAKALLQAKLQSRDERLDHLIINARLCIRYKNAQSLGAELPIQIEAVNDVCSVFHTPLFAVECVVLFLLLTIRSTRCLLHFAAMATQLEAWALALLVGYLEILPRLAQLAEIDIPEVRPCDELKPEWQAVRLDPPGVAHILGVKIRQQLPGIELGLPVFRAIVNPHLRIVAVGNRLLETQQGPALRNVAPHRIPAARAIGMYIDLGIVFAMRAQQLHVMAGRTQAPVLQLGQIHVDLVHLHPPLIRVEAIFRRELGDRRGCRAFILDRGQRHISALTHVITALLAPQDRLQLHPGLREGIVRNQAGVGQRVKQLALVYFLHQHKGALPLPIQLVDFCLGRLVLRLGLKRLDLVLAGIGALAMLLTLKGEPLQQLEHRNTQTVQVLGALVILSQTFLSTSPIFLIQIEYLQEASQQSRFMH